MNLESSRRARRAIAVGGVLLAAALLASVACAADGLHTFWSVKGQYNTVYLLGSVHVLKPADSELPPEALRAYSAAKAVVMELDLSAVAPETMLDADLSLETLPPGQTLADALGPQAYATLIAHAKPLGLNEEFLSHFQPWFAAVTLAQLEIAQLGFDANSGVDAQFAQRAQTDHKPIIALETMDEQLGFFAHMPLDQQRRFVLYTLDDVDESAKEVDAVVTAWRHGDTKTLERLLGEGFDKFPDLYRMLTTDRNRKWMPTIAGLLHEKQDYLVVVGALHLVGQDGVVELLERQGYKVEQR
jgi:uncharacterized protein YbaP (TraB family)